MSKTTTTRARSTELTRRRAAEMYTDLRSHALKRTWAVGAIDQEDVAHTMALAILTGTRVQYAGAALTFSYRRALDTLRTEMRTQARTAASLDTTDEFGVIQDERWTTERSDALLDGRTLIRRLAEVLPAWGPRMLEMIAAGHNREEIAEAFGIAPGNVSARMTRIRQAAERLAAGEQTRLATARMCA